MRLLRVGLWSSLGLPLIAGCVSAPGGYAAYQQAPRMELALAALENGGPGAQVRVTTVRRPGQVPMIEPSFSIADDGYVLVGTLGSNGSVRVIFPTEPTDDGRVEGGRSYRLPPVVPGEAYDLGGDLSLARSRTGELWNTGYVFIIA